jgi:hypothetical protein
MKCLSWGLTLHLHPDQFSRVVDGLELMLDGRLLQSGSSGQG